MNFIISWSEAVGAAEKYHFSPFNICLGLFGIYFSYTVFYGLFLCPTRHIPGPFLTRFSYWPYNVLLFRGQGCMETRALHEKYGTTLDRRKLILGPAVRLAPDMVDIQSVDAAQEAWAGIHPKLPWDKDPDFCRMVRAGMPVDNVLSTQRFKDAMRIRRLIGTPFAKKFLLDQEYIFKECTKKMLNVLETARIRDGTVDVAHHFMKYAFDLLSIPSQLKTHHSGIRIWGVFQGCEYPSGSE
jgi:hypothetical protein